MTLLYIAVCLLALLRVSECGCRNSNWWASLDKPWSLSKCDGPKENINGLWRSKRLIPDRISFIEQAQCCTPPPQYMNVSTQVAYADWWYTFDKNNNWNECPKGFFLQGLYRSEKGPKGNEDKLWSIEFGRCMKPSSHPRHYGVDNGKPDCYDQNIVLAFDKQGWGKCRAGYFVTGLYRGICDELFCLEYLRCCKMADKPDALDSVDKVKDKVMDETMSEMAHLAMYLGYGGASGCWADGVGEDFKRDGNSWKGENRTPCPIHGTDHDYHHRRLTMTYGNWKFKTVDMNYSTPVTEDLKPESIDSIVIPNRSSSPVVQKITREEAVTTTVTHTALDAWTSSHEVGIKIGYSMGSILPGPSGSAHYNFNYETSSETTDSSGKEQAKTFRTETTVTAPPHTLANATLILSKTRKTITYKAKIIAEFSVEFSGYMMDRRRNYHEKYQDSNDRPSFKYTFGDENTPFYKALSDQSSHDSSPWKWTSIFNNHNQSQNIITSLTNTGRYEFTLSGKFEGVSGKDLTVMVDSQPIDASNNVVGRSVREDLPLSGSQVIHKTVAKQRPGDPAPVFPPVPHMTLDPAVYYSGPAEPMPE